MVDEGLPPRWRRYRPSRDHRRAARRTSLAWGRREEEFSGGGDGRETLVVDSGLDDAVGHQLVGGYLTDWYSAPENVWRYYTDDGVLCSLDIDGTRHVATERTEIQKLFNDVAAPKTGNHEDSDDEYRSLVVQSIVTVRCPSGQLLVVATTKWFTQTFVVEYKAPDPAVSGVTSVAVVASVVTVKGVGAYPQTLLSPRRRAQTKTPSWCGRLTA